MSTTEHALLLQAEQVPAAVVGGATAAGVLLGLARRVLHDEPEPEGNVLS